MKVRYKIMAAFMLITLIILTTLCVFIYYNTATQQESDFAKRLQNRANTVGSLLFAFPGNEYYFLSKLDSATSNLLQSENIMVYNSRNQRIYRFVRNYPDTVSVDIELLNDTRVKSRIYKTIGDTRIVSIYYSQSVSPVVIIVSAVDKNGEINLMELKRSLIIAMFIGAFLSLLSSWLFSKRLLKPIDRISMIVSNITAGNIEKRLMVSLVDDEWNRLSVTFNNLLSRLQESLEIQGRFISNASHELSTPLTSISNQIDVALQKERSKETYLAVLQSVQSDAKEMGALIQQLLNIARTSRGGTIHTDLIRIDEVIMELPSMLKKISPVYNVSIFFDEFPEDEKQCMVNGNHELLLSAFKNIAENGCKYAPDNTVNISLSFVAGRIIILFSNNAEKIHQSELEDIFQPFQRGSNASAVSGYGLGLSLTRRIILLHSGEIKAEINDSGNMLITVILPSDTRLL